MRIAPLRPFRRLQIAPAALALAALPALAQQLPVESVRDAITEGRLSLQLRPRYEDVSDDYTAENGHAWTMRSILGWRTAVFEGWRVMVEAIHTDVVDARHVDTSAAQYGESAYPLLPDPRSTDTNRVYVEYLNLPDTLVRLGKQPIRLDNERFFSDVDFRQVPMLFNGLTVVNNSLPDTELYAAFANRVRTVFATQARTRIWLLRAAYSPLQDQSVAAFVYGMNQPQDGNDTWLADNSHEVAGLRAEGVVPTGLGFSAAYTAEAAHQRRYAGGDPLIEADYWRLGAGVVWPGLAGFGARVDQEVKTSNRGQYAFQMPFENTYAFNGWVSQFTNTPPTGLRDAWVTLRAQPGRFQLFAQAHRFSATYGSLEYGHEVDLRAAYAATSSLTLALQYARFHGVGDTGGWFDYYGVSRTWVSLTYDY